MIFSQATIGPAPPSCNSSVLNCSTIGDLFGTRIQLQGPDLILRPEAAQNIGIALHELSTNAAKFGALSMQRHGDGLLETHDR